MSQTFHTLRPFARRQAWLVVVLLGLLANVIGFVTHDHPASKSHVEVCDWCVAHGGFAAPPQHSITHNLDARPSDEPVQPGASPIHSSDVLAARSRGPPLV